MVNCCCNVFSLKWWRMLWSPLVTALERDEKFMEGVLRAAEGDSSLQLEWIQAESASASLTRVHVRGRCDTNSKKYSKTLLVKRPPDKRRPRDPVWINEVTMFTNVLPTLRLSNATLPFPRCLHVSSFTIMLEDVTTRGFIKPDLFTGLDLQQSRGVLQALGRFHGSSLALKYQNRSVFDSLTIQLREVVFVPEAAPLFASSTESALDLAILNLKQCSELIILDAVHTLQRLRGKTFHTLVSLVTPKEPLSVICHGDFWVNNVMLSRESGGEVVITDLQMARHSSLAVDLLHFLCTSLEVGLLYEFVDNLLSSYHHSLVATMEELAAPAPSLQDIHCEIERNALYGLLMSFLVSSSSHSYSLRLKEIVLMFVEKGFI